MTRSWWRRAVLPALAAGCALSVLAAACGWGADPPPATPPDPAARLAAMTNGQGEIAGEVTATSVILQSRLTSAGGLVDGDLPGVDGVARFELSTTPDFADPIVTDWLDATADGDHIVKTAVRGLAPGTAYLYRVVYGPDRAHTASGPIRSFATHPGPGAAARTGFTVVTGMNYHHFYDNPARAYTGPDRELGFPALEAMRALEPDFFVATGDSVYYDTPYDGRAATAPAMRRKWHQQLVRPRFIDFFADTPTYWEKDDHDYRFNDCDNTGALAPSPALGRRIFLEQVPVVDPADPDPRTYRTHRVSRDLQIWLVEGRDYRSPNMADPGPDKTLWGARQLAWFQETLLASDATFKILISPTPLVGPDDADQAGRAAPDHDPAKRDNHSNPLGFRHERDALFAWLTRHGFLDRHFYIVTGDRHWQYHSRDPSGFEEFSTGALVDANARVGRAPGDPASNDPDALVTQLYTYDEPTGGFLHVVVTPGPPPTLAFRFHDERGALLYDTVKTAD